MAKTRCLICNCEATMAPDAAALAQVPGVAPSPIHSQLCRAQLDRFEAALAEGAPLIVGCTQEAPLFEELAGEAGVSARFVNLRETAGWSAEGAAAGPKMAALLAGAAYEAAPARAREVTSDGLCLIYGADQAAVEAAKLLAPRLSVTLLLCPGADVMLPPALDFPVFQGHIARLSGSFGGFDLVVDGYAPLRPASRGALEFAAPKDGARSRCSLVLDLSGRAPLVTGPEKRDGYERVDPGDPAAMLRAAFALSDMVGSFEKPLYVTYDPAPCAHARSQITGCSNCLDACPAGAITAAGDGVAVDAGICGGCGICAARCPTGAIRYDYPTRADQLGQAQAMLAAYRAAGGADPILLLHEAGGAEMIAAIARYGRGLPARVIPLERHSVTGLGHLELCALVAAGAAGLVVLSDPAKAAELPPLEQELALAEAILSGLGAGGGRSQIITAPDPLVVEAALWDLAPPPARAAQTITDPGRPRDLARLTFAALKDGRAEGRAEAPLPLPEGAPYGAVEIDPEACTLCMACTSACPTGALMDTPGAPALRFAEGACVQCGLCTATCPERALRLTPRLNLAPEAAQPATLYEEAPFACISCGKEFATRSTIARIQSQLAGQHPMFASPERARLIEMCETCRVEAQANSAEDPFSQGTRPQVRTTDDYLIED